MGKTRRLPPGIRPKKGGGYEGRFVQHYADGTSKRLSFYGPTVDDVLNQMADARRDPRSRDNAKDQSLQHFLEKVWLPIIKPDPGVQPSGDDGKVRSNTHSLRKGAVAHVVDTLVQGKPFGDRKLSRLEPEDIDDLLEALALKKVGARMRQVVHQTLSVSLKYALKKRLVRENVMAMVDKPKYTPKPKRILTDAEQTRLFAEARKDPMHYAVTVLAATTGMREGELLALKWSNIDFDKGEIKIKATLTRTEIVTDDGSTRTKLAATAPKTDMSKRDIKPPGFALDALRAYWKRRPRFEPLAAPEI